MQTNDPIDDLAPFLDAKRNSESSDIHAPPEHLTARLIASRPFAKTGSPLAPVPEEELPTKFGPYTLESILGRGSTGTVYAAHDPELDRRIAVKVLAPELATLPEARERFHREAQSAAGLQHDNLMSVLAVHQDTPYPCLTMPLLEGETLHAKLNREGPIAPEALLAIATQITTALEAAHSAGIIHRDLKPSNIFLASAGDRAILMDFGLARALDAPSELTLAGSVLGTPEFLAPEQIDDQPDLTAAVDLYGLGATLYTLAKAKPPFASSSLTGLLKKVATEPPSPIEIPGFPGWFAQLILALLSKSPADRPASASHVLTFLRNEAAPSKTTTPSSILRWAALLLIPLLAFAVWKVGQKPFSLTKALASGTSNIVIPNPGIFDLPTIDLGNRDLTITAKHPGTILRMTAVEKPAFTTAGTLAFDNLTLRLHTPTLVRTTGKSLTFTHCRIEQSGIPDRELNKPAMVLADKPLGLTLDHTALLSFQSLLFDGPSKSAIILRDSFVHSPAIVRATDVGGQVIECTRSTLICSNTFILDPAEPTHIQVRDSHLEANYAILQIDSADRETIRRSVTWEGQGNTLACARRWLSTNPTKRTRQPQPAGINRFEDWQAFWPNDTSRASSPTLLNLRLPQTTAHPSEVDLTTLVHGQSTGAKLDKLGPR